MRININKCRYGANLEYAGWDAEELRAEVEHGTLQGCEYAISDLLDHIECIPAMLEQAKRDAWEEAAKAVCVDCNLGVVLHYSQFHGYFHITRNGDIPCRAAPIRRKLAEQPAKGETK